MHLRTSSGRPSKCFLGYHGSAQAGLPRAIQSALPSSMILAAISGAIILPTVPTGMSVTSFIRLASGTRHPCSQ